MKKENEILVVAPIELKQQAIVDYSGIDNIIKSVEYDINKLDLDNLLDFNVSEMKDDEFKEFVENNLNNIKNVRSDLRKKFAEYEDARKTFKRALEKPYKEFKKEYDKLAKILTDTDVKLKKAVDQIEDAEKEAIRAKVEKYYLEVKAIKEEELKELGYDLSFIKFQDLGINIIKSLTESQFKKQVNDFFEKVHQNLLVVNTHEYSRRVYVKYVNTLDLTKSLTEVQLEVKQEEELLNKQQEKPKVVEQPKEQVVSVPKVEEILILRFEVEDTKENIIKVREFMKENKINYRGVE